jgi:hypothetical protein
MYQLGVTEVTRSFMAHFANRNSGSTREARFKVVHDLREDMADRRKDNASTRRGEMWEKLADRWKFSCMVGWGDTT